MQLKIKLLLAIISFLLTFCTGTQTTQSNQAQSTRLSGDLERIATQQTAEMISKLNLTDIQIPKVKEINLAYAKKTQELRQKSGGDRSYLLSLRESINKDKLAEMKQVLTDSQFKIYEDMQVENTDNRGNRDSRSGVRSRY